jgi:hypothetical protein
VAVAVWLCAHEDADIANRILHFSGSVLATRSIGVVALADSLVDFAAVSAGVYDCGGGAGVDKSAVVFAGEVDRVKSEWTYAHFGIEEDFGPSLRDLRNPIQRSPKLESLGYCRQSLRDLSLLRLFGPGIFKGEGAIKDKLLRSAVCI